MDHTRKGFGSVRMVGAGGRWRAAGRRVGFATSVSGAFTTLRGMGVKMVDPGDIVEGEEVGRGAFGAVRVCEIASLGGAKAVAKKMLVGPRRGGAERVGEERLGEEEMPLGEFAKEFELLSKLSHPNVVRTIGAAETDDGGLVILQEYVSGGTLKEYVTGKAPCDARLAVTFLVGVARAMAYLHSRTPKVLHRDLKADNVLVDGEVAKVCDFGLAKLVEKDPEPGDGGEGESGRPKLQRTMTANVGSGRYMAPENMKGEEYDEKIDVFSFGILAWELLNGELAYSDPKYKYVRAQDILRHVSKEGLRPAIPGTWPDCVTELVTSCWDQEAYLRPDFPHVVDALKEIQGDDGALDALDAAKRGSTCGCTCT